MAASRRIRGHGSTGLLWQGRRSLWFEEWSTGVLATKSYLRGARLSTDRPLGCPLTVCSVLAGLLLT
jgi:hypothetical protein